MSHLIKMAELIGGDKIATDDWRATFYDTLRDLDFELDGIYDMSFEHETRRDGKEKYLHMKVYQTKNHSWVLEIKNDREKKPVKREYKKFQTLSKVVHSIFSKF